MASEKESRVRLALLRSAVQRDGGVWTTKRVQDLYRGLGLLVSARSVFRGDLLSLVREGALRLDDSGNDRRFLPPRRGR